MKPQDLKAPFSRREGSVMIEDRIWYVPNYHTYDDYESFSFSGWENPELFGNTHPICIEYCSGNGAWIAEKALQFPEKNWVAVEMKFDRVRKIWAKIKNYQLDNLLIVSGEALCATQHFFPEDSVETIYVNFPDPWPKKRHFKNRLIQQPFLDQLHRVLFKEGEVVFVTDHEGYSEWTVKEFLDHHGFVSTIDAPFYTLAPKEYGSSYFDQLWREKGLQIRYHQFRKR